MAEAEEAPAKKSGLSKVLLPVGFVIIAGASAAGGYLMNASKAGAAPAAEPAAPAHPAPAVVPGAKGSGPVEELEPFVVNLKDEGQLFYLKMKVALELAAPEWVDQLEKHKLRVRNKVLLHLSNLTIGETFGVENKQKIEEALTKTAKEILGPASVIHVYITEFVVQ